MDTDWVEQLLVKEFGQLLSSVHSVHENDCLVEGQ